MDIKFQVITDMGASGDLLDGTLCDDIAFEREFKNEYGPVEKAFLISPMDYEDKFNTDFVRIKRPVFEIGEIVIVNEYGREYGPIGRKPSKWCVGFEEFDNLEKAIQRSVEIIKREIK